MLNLIKLVVGVSSLEELAERQKQSINCRLHPEHGPLPVVHTRSYPRRCDEVLEGGSLYRVISGLILCRQPILDIVSEARPDGTQGTLILLSPQIIRVEARALRPFQGWRYLESKDAPPDLGSAATSQAALPSALQKELTLLGL